MTPHHVTLLSYFRSSCSYRVRIGLELLGRSHGTTVKTVNLLRAEHTQPAYTALCSNQRVPLLLIAPRAAAAGQVLVAPGVAATAARLAGRDDANGTHLTLGGESLALSEVPGAMAVGDSMAILELLDAGHFLFPPGTSRLQRARVTALTNVIASDTQPIQNIGVLKAIKDSATANFGAEWTGPHSAAWMNRWNRRGLSVFEEHLRGEGTTFSFSDDAPGAADVAMLPTAYNAARFGVDLADEFPLVWTAACALHALSRPAHPSLQPDCNVDDAARGQLAFGDASL